MQNENVTRTGHDDCQEIMEWLRAHANDEARKNPHLCAFYRAFYEQSLPGLLCHNDKKAASVEEEKEFRGLMSTLGKYFELIGEYQMAWKVSSLANTRTQRASDYL